MVLRQDVVDGIPVFWPENSDTPDLLSGSLLFRTGKVHETLPLNGITHLVEHLVLHDVADSLDDVHRNGRVTTSFTSFDVTATPDKAARFFVDVCARLGDLPLDHLESERRVLEVEEARSSTGPVLTVLFERYGAQGPGLWYCADFGRDNATDDEIRTWASTRFVRGGAVLVLNGPPPSGLRLSLPDGEGTPLPPLTEVIGEGPVWSTHGFEDAVAHTVVERSAESVAWSAVTRMRLMARLRGDLGIAYSPNTLYDPYDADLATVSLVADAHPDHLQQAAEVLAEEIDLLALEGPSQQELDAHRTTLLHQFTDPVPEAGLAYQRALDHLVGRESTSLEGLRREVEQLDIERVREAGMSARRRLVYGVPEAVGLPPERATRLPSWSLHSEVVGSTYRPATGEPVVITVGADAVSYRGQDDDYVVVPYRSCRGALAWPDGRRVLISDEGLTLTIEPNLWIGGRGLVGLVDQRTEHVRVSMPARDRDDIPMIAEDPPDLAPLKRGGDVAMIWGAIILALALANGQRALAGGGVVYLPVAMGAVGVIAIVGGLIARLAFERAERFRLQRNGSRQAAP